MRDIIRRDSNFGASFCCAMRKESLGCRESCSLSLSLSLFLSLIRIHIHILNALLKIPLGEQDWTRALYFCSDGILIHRSSRSRTSYSPCRRRHCEVHRHFCQVAKFARRGIVSENAKKIIIRNSKERSTEKETEFLLKALIQNSTITFEIL